VLRAAVSVPAWDSPSTTAQPMSLGHTAGGVPADCFGLNHACAGCLNRRCGGTLGVPMTGSPRSIRRAGMGQCCCDTNLGSMHMYKALMGHSTG
jgi:hypothetical protein